MHHLPNENAVIQLEITTCDSQAKILANAKSNEINRTDTAGFKIQDAKKKVTLSRKRTPAFLPEPTFSQISTSGDYQPSCCRAFLQLPEPCTSLCCDQAAEQPATGRSCSLLNISQNTAFLLHLTFLKSTSKSAWRKYCFTDLGKINLFIISYAVSFPGTQS